MRKLKVLGVLVKRFFRFTKTVFRFTKAILARQGPPHPTLGVSAGSPTGVSAGSPTRIGRVMHTFQLRLPLYSVASNDFLTVACSRRQDRKVKVSLFLHDHTQNTDGSIVVPPYDMQCFMWCEDDSVAFHFALDSVCPPVQHRSLDK